MPSFPGGLEALAPRVVMQSLQCTLVRRVWYKRTLGGGSVFAIHKSSLALGCMAFCLAVLPAAGAHAATWTFTPELKRLDAEGNELSTGSVDIARHQSLMVGVYIRVTSDGAARWTTRTWVSSPSAGAIHFESEELNMTDIGPVVRSLRGGQGWQRRMANASFDPVADGWLGPPEESDNETSWIAFWSDPTNARANPRGAWCAAENGGCSIFVGVLAISVANLPQDAVGNLSLRFGGVTSPEESVAVGAMFGRADESVENGNTITYNLCPTSDARLPTRTARRTASRAPSR